MTAPAFSLPTISVVVPSFNQGRYLRQTLDSLFRQDYPGLEVVVMDGGSTDDSVAIIRDYADRLARWQSGPDGGQSAAINAGVARCRGTLAAWLNSDDYYCDDCLWTVGRAYDAFPGRGLYLGIVVDFSGVLAGDHGQADDRVLVDPDEAAGLPDAAVLLKMLEDGYGFVLGKLAAIQGRPLAFREALPAGPTGQDAGGFAGP